MRSRTYVLVLVTFVATGCASIFHGTTERLSIHTSVPSAQIFIDERYIGQGSVTTNVDSTKGHSIHVRANGYHDAWAGVGLDPAIGYYAIDLLFTLGIGIAIDLATGAITTFEHNEIALNLAPLGAEMDASGQLLAAPPLKAAPAPGPAPAQAPAEVPPAPPTAPPPNAP
jgi:hypothetical protein